MIIMSVVFMMANFRPISFVFRGHSLVTLSYWTVIVIGMVVMVVMVVVIMIIVVFVTVVSFQQRTKYGKLGNMTDRLNVFRSTDCG
jgi:uncharacterized membrane protein